MTSHKNWSCQALLYISWLHHRPCRFLNARRSNTYFAYILSFNPNKSAGWALVFYPAKEVKGPETLWHSTQVHVAPNSPSRKGTQVLLDCNMNDLLHTLRLPRRAEGKQLRRRRQKVTFKNIFPHPHAAHKDRANSISLSQPQLLLTNWCIHPRPHSLKGSLQKCHSIGHTHPGAHLSRGFPRE